MGSGSTEAILEIINWRSLVHFCCWYVNLIGEFGHEFGQVSNTLITNSLVNLIFWVQFRNQGRIASHVVSLLSVYFDVPSWYPGKSLQFYCARIAWKSRKEK